MLFRNLAAPPAYRVAHLVRRRRRTPANIRRGLSRRVFLER